MDNVIMDFKEIKKYISIAVYGLVSIIIALIIVRVFLLVIGANTGSLAVSFIYNTSEIFVAMFRGIYPNVLIDNGRFVIEIFSINALMFYLAIAFLVQKSIKSVFESDSIQLLTNIIDTVFKFAEFILITRFILKLTGASVASQFVRILYDISGMIYEPFKGILPGYSIPSLNSVFETSTIIAIIIIIVFDVLTEGVIAHMRKESDEFEAKKTVKQSKQQAPNITINLPQQKANQQPTTQYIDSRTVHVVAPNTPLQPARPNYPYFGTNQLENQRPARMQQLDGQGYYNQPHGRPIAPRNANPDSANS
jgi:hypothetical protein